MIYFDNSASTLIKPKEVITATMTGLTKYSANPGRSGHKLSIESAIKIEEVRQKVADFVNTQNVVFTQNCTDALNLAIQGTFKPYGHIICTSNDHNASIRPIFELQKKYGNEVTIIEPKNSELLTLDDILPNIKKNTYLICVNHISNVNGDLAEISKIGEFCDKNNILFLVDGAQSIGHIKIDMQKDHIDMLAIAPHKGLYSPQGIGALAFNSKVNISPIRYGGTGTESENIYQPNEGIERYESGTIATPNILGLGAGIDFVKHNFNKIKEKIEDLSIYLLYELSNINGVTVYTNPNNLFGVIGFNIKNYGSTEISQELSSNFDLCTRGGLHCAGVKHKQLGTLSQGIVRVSLSYFNTFSECQKLVNTVKFLATKK